MTLFLGDVLDIMEQRHDWASFALTPEHFKYVLTQMIPEVIMHSKSQDEEQVRDHYDSTLRVSTRLFLPLMTLPPSNRRRRLLRMVHIH